MKIYIKSNTDPKPPLPKIEVFWGNTEDNSTWMAVVNLEDNTYLVNNEYSYDDYDADSIYYVATQDAIDELSEFYTLSEEDIKMIRNK